MKIAESRACLVNRKNPAFSKWVSCEFPAFFDSPDRP
jgi:hypothetical protein